MRDLAGWKSFYARQWTYNERVGKLTSRPLEYVKIGHIQATHETLGLTMIVRLTLVSVFVRIS